MQSEVGLFGTKHLYFFNVFLEYKYIQNRMHKNISFDDRFHVVSSFFLCFLHVSVYSPPEVRFESGELF